MSLSNTNSTVNAKDGSGDESMSSTKLSNNLVVRIDQDSDDNLQALFDSVLNPGDAKRPLQVPFRMRKLPNSFFNPPAANPSATHSRANSADSAYDAGSQSNVNKAALPSTPTDLQPPNVSSSISQSQIPLNRLAVFHSRAHSSPASLQQTYNINSRNEGNVAVAACNQGSSFANNTVGFNNNNNTNTNTAAAVGVNNIGIERMGQMAAGVGPKIANPLQTFHMKQRSYDVVSPIQLQNELGALPPGWEQAKTNDGQIYYLNHTTKTTQWEDPRIQYRQQQQQQLQQRPLPANPPDNTRNSKSESTIADNIGPLPEGWEQAFTESGDCYFINHIERTTSWNDPRIPDFMQKSVKLAKAEINWANNMRQVEKDDDIFKPKLPQNVLNRHTNSIQMDPFLSGDNHARQESSDSGLSLSSNTFEFIPPVDDSMDGISEHGLNVLDCPDNLVSSLQLEDNICNEMFTDVQNMLSSPSSSTKNENLEWYKIN